jgi:mRNA interferase RelE/StbE
VASVRIPDDVAALIRGLHPDLKKKVRAALAVIVADASAGKALKAELDGLRSYRVGRFRIVYRWESQELEVVAVGPRRLIYEETWRRIRKGG